MNMNTIFWSYKSTIRYIYSKFRGYLFTNGNMDINWYFNFYLIDWTIFAFCSPLFAYFTWMTKEKGIIAKIISFGVVLVSILSSIILFDGLRIYDFLIDGLLIYYLFF